MTTTNSRDIGERAGQVCESVEPRCIANGD
jgi:hypothetical protein